MAAGIFIFPRYSEQRFELKNSEFRYEIKFWKSLHFGPKKLRKKLNDNIMKGESFLSS